MVKLGAAGTAIATVAAQYASFAASIVFLYKRRAHFGFEFKLTSFRIIPEHMVILLKLGIPMAVQTACVHLTQLYCSAQINAYGLVESATNGIGTRIYKLLNVITSSVSSGSGAIIGQNLGAGKYDRTKKVVLSTLSITAVLAATEISLALLIPRQLFRLFTTDTGVIEYGVTYMRILTIAFFLSALQGPTNAMVTGSGNSNLSFVSGFLDGVVLRSGISLLFSKVFNLGVIGYFYGNVLAHLAPCVIGIVYCLSGRWKTFRLLKSTQYNTYK